MGKALELHQKMDLGKEIMENIRPIGKNPNLQARDKTNLTYIEIDNTILQRILPKELYRPARNINAKIRRVNSALLDIENGTLSKTSVGRTIMDGIKLAGESKFAGDKKHLSNVLTALETANFSINEEQKQLLTALLHKLRSAQTLKLYNLIGEENLALFSILESKYVQQRISVLKDSNKGAAKGTT